MQHGIPPPLVREVQGMIDQWSKGELAPNTANEDIWDILVSNELGKVKLLHTDEVMCHMANRGTLGLNGHNVHRNGNDIDAVGCDPKLLNSAAAFEVCPFEPLRSQQFVYNRQLVAQAKGLLADLTGREHCCSAGTGHFTAWCRAINHNCVTPYKKLAGPDGKLLPDRFRAKDKRMGGCLDVGINFRYYPWQVELAWPQLPALVQSALNSSHMVNTTSNELIVMAALAEGDKTRVEGQTFEEVIKCVELCNPPCKDYLSKVGALAQECGGGEGVPLVKLLDRFSKSFGLNKMLGEEFLGALVDFQPSKTKKFGYLKVAFMATNLAGNVIRDGISRLIVKSDVDKLKSRASWDQIVAVNDRIGVAWSITEELLLNGLISPEAFDLMIGKFMVRQVLFITGKQANGPDKKTFTDLDHIRCVFLESIMGECGYTPVDLGEWTNIWKAMKLLEEEAAAGAEPSVKKPKRNDGLKRFDEIEDPMTILVSKGFALDGWVKEKAVESDVYKFVKLDVNTVYLKVFSMFGEDQSVVAKIPWIKFLEGWSPYNGTLPALLHFKPPNPVDAKIFLSDLTRFRAFDAILKYEKQCSERRIRYRVCPCGVLAEGDIAKGCLTFAPLTMLSSVQIPLAADAKDSAIIPVTVAGDRLVLRAMPKPSPKLPDDKVENLNLCLSGGLNPHPTKPLSTCRCLRQSPRTMQRCSSLSFRTPSP